VSCRVLSLILIVSLPTFASALPVDLAGFGDSITCWNCNDGSYLVLLENWGYVDSAEDASHGVSGNRTHEVLTRLEDWIDASSTADLLILLTGTPDTYQTVGGFWDRDYDPAETLSNVEAMVDLVLLEAIPLILVAPTPVLDPCAYPDELTCDVIDTRLADLAGDLALLASDHGVPFLDLYAAFAADPRFGLIADGGQHPGPDSLYRDDGTHPRLTTGDTLLASLLAPMIPEPSTALLLASGLLVLAHRRARRREEA